MAPGVTGLKLQDDRWEPFFTYSGSRSFISALGVCPLGEPGRFAILLQSFSDSVRVIEVRAGEVAGETQIGGGLSSDVKNSAWIFAGIAVIPAMMSLILSFSLSAFMTRYRQCEFVAATQSVRFASLTRRVNAKLIDGLIASLPSILGVILLISNFDVEKMLESLEEAAHQMGFVLIWVTVIIFWGFALFLVFSFLEGRWGLTPGKWMMGIRVLGTDLKPRGFLMALVRNLLLFIDVFFNCLVGILLIAFTPNWQRLGDMAAGTVVVHPSRPLEPMQQPEP